jgi:hypothetical protein
MMPSLFRTGWRRDVLIGVLASGLTMAVLVSLAWAAVRQERARVEDARRLVALQAARLARPDAALALDEARRALVEQAADVLGNLGGPAKSEAEVMGVSSDAVAPEVPQGAYLLIDKKAAAYSVGDIVVFRVGENNYLGRVVTVDKEAGHMTVGRNHEADRQVVLGDVLGRGVLNTR